MNSSNTRLFFNKLSIPLYLRVKQHMSKKTGKNHRVQVASARCLGKTTSMTREVYMHEVVTNRPQQKCNNKSVRMIVSPVVQCASGFGVGGRTRGSRGHHCVPL